MSRNTKLSRVTMLFLASLAAGCGESSTGPVVVGGSALVLNSTGQTLAGYVVDGEALEREGGEIDLGPTFDGDAVDVNGTTAATTVSSFNGSQLLLLDLESGEIETIVFPGSSGLDSTRVNPSRATLAGDGTVWVGGRGSDAVYRAESGIGIATRVAEDVGTFVQRVLPVGDRLYAVDGNLDDDGFTYQPLGPSRVVVLTQFGTVLDVVTLPPLSVGAVDAVVVDDRLIVLAAGSFDANFAPQHDGTLVSIDLGTLTVDASLSLSGNGISIEAGRDGLVYVTTTLDFAATRTLSFDPAGRRFVHGPDDPIAVVDEGGDAVSCWTTTAVAEDRLLCVTFRSDAPGRLVLTRADGGFLSEIAAGFGSTDIQLR